MDKNIINISGVECYNISQTESIITYIDAKKSAKGFFKISLWKCFSGRRGRFFMTLGVLAIQI